MPSAVSFHVGLIPNRPVSEIAELAQLAEELGFDGAWIADSNVIFRDGWAALTLAAAATKRIKLATGVTNPVTRHLSVLAGSMATLDELSGGRAILGIGVGESSVYTAGLRRARLSEFEAATEALRLLMHGKPAVVGGHEMQITWSTRDVPIVIASSGPRSLQLAGRVADGVLCQAGADASLVGFAVRNVRTGAKATNRPHGEPMVYSRLACSVDPDRTWARNEVRGYAAAAAGTTFSAMPEDELPVALTQDLARMKASYDYRAHTSSRAAHNDLLTDRIIDSLSISGTPEEAIPRFQELIALGVRGFVIPITSSDPERSMRTLAESVIPAVVEAAQPNDPTKQ